MTATTLKLGPFDLERVFRAVDKITERLNRAAAALNAAGVPYAVIGGNAVANWVGRVKPEAIRFTKDVDLLIRRADVDAAEEALKPIGFRRRQALGITFFLDGPDSKFEDAIHLVFANEKVRSEYLLPAPDVDECEAGPNYRVLGLEPLVRMKLTSYRRKDQMHLVDFINTGLIDETWPDHYPPELAERLRELLNDENERWGFPGQAEV